MNSDAALARLADIVPPPAPTTASADYSWIGAALLSIFLLAAILYVWRRHRRRRNIEPQDAVQQLRAAALAQLHALKLSWAARRLSDRDTAYRLAVILRRGLGLSQLGAATPPSIDTATWQEILTLLDRWRYRDDGDPKIGASPSKVDNQRLPSRVFEHAERCLSVAREERT